jgi:RimJ/RimL family protein N-acetyltransferase
MNDAPTPLTHHADAGLAIKAGLQRSNQALIRTDRLLLRPARSDDLPALCALWRDPEVCRYLGEGDVPKPEQVALRLCEHLCMARDGLGLWLLQRPADGRLLGCVTLRVRPGAQPGTLEPGVALHPQHRGHGYAHEALTALLAHGVEALGAVDLVASCCVPDRAADRLLRRLGFVARYECEGGRYRLRQYRPGVRHGDCGVVTRLSERGRRRAA